MSNLVEGSVALVLEDKVFSLKLCHCRNAK